MQIQLENDKCYIIKEITNSGYPSVIKIEVKEVTNTTVLYRNLDSESKYRIRMELETFDSKWAIIEDLGLFNKN